MENTVIELYLPLENKQNKTKNNISLLFTHWLLAMQYGVTAPHCNGLLLDGTHHKISNIRRTKSPNLNVSRLVLQLSLPNPMKPGVKSRMKM